MSEKPWYACDVLAIGGKVVPAVELSPEEIQDELSRLLFKGVDGAVDPEMLSIMIRRDKVGDFDFLKAKTEWATVGFWETDKNPPEPNMQIDVIFWDIPKSHPQDSCREAVGLRLMELLEEYNKKVVGEKLLYARTQPVEETTLSQD